MACAFAPHRNMLMEPLLRNMATVTLWAPEHRPTSAVDMEGKRAHSHSLKIRHLLPNKGVEEHLRYFLKTK